MARNLDEEVKVRARRLYIHSGIANMTELARIVGASRSALTRLRDEEDWDKQRKNTIVTPQEIAQELSSIIAEIIAEIREKRATGDIVAPSVKKDLIVYTRALRNLDDQYDSRGSFITMMRKYLEFVGKMPASKLKDKAKFIKQLQDTIPAFISEIEHG
jgi:hypothetical protein